MYVSVVVVVGPVIPAHAELGLECKTQERLQVQLWLLRVQKYLINVVILV